MKFISVFLERPRILFLTLAFILLSGISSLLSVPIQENPELAERWGNVSVFYPGASPERIETQWWNVSDVLRDYYVAFERNGSRLWIYRERKGTKKWYLHGYFS